MKPEDEKTEQEKIEEEIAELKSRIKNTEYDITHMFKGNAMLESKLDSSKKTLAEKETLLSQIKSNPKSAKKLNEVESTLDEESTTEISQEQEQILNEEIEKELE